MSKSLYTTIVEETAPTTSTIGIVGQLYLDTSTKTLYQCVERDTSTSSYTWKEIGGGSGVSQEDFNKLVNNEINIANNVSGTTSGNFKAGENASGLGVAIGSGANGINFSDVAIGLGARATAGNSTAIGRSSLANAALGVAIGNEAKAQATNSIQLGKGANKTLYTLQVFDDNIYNHNTHTLTVQNIELNGETLKSHSLKTLTLAGDAVLTSTETFTTHTQILVEFETDGIHAGFDCILHPYDEAICMVTYDVLTNGTPHFGTCYLDDTGHVIVNVPSGMTFTNIKAHYIDLGG